MLLHINMFFFVGIVIKSFSKAREKEFLCTVRRLSNVGIYVDDVRSCAGNLLNFNAVITVADCCNKMGKHLVTVKVNGTEISEVDKFVIHPDYKQSNYYDNVCLLKLNTGILQGNNIQYGKFIESSPFGKITGKICKDGEVWYDNGNSNNSFECALARRGSINYDTNKFVDVRVEKPFDPKYFEKGLPFVCDDHRIHFLFGLAVKMDGPVIYSHTLYDYASFIEDTMRKFMENKSPTKNIVLLLVCICLLNNIVVI